MMARRLVEADLLLFKQVLALFALEHIEMGQWIGLILEQSNRQ